MAGFTTAGVRRLLLEQGAGAASTGLVDAEGLERGSPGSLRRASREAAPGPQILQLFTNQAESLQRAAACAGELGYDGVELNLGCPASPLLARGCGGALLGRWPELRVLLKALCEASDLPAGIKCRSGQVPGDGHFLILHELAAEAGLDWFCLHPRSLAGGYEECPDWGLFDQLPPGGPRLWAVGELRSAAQARAALAAHPTLEAVLIGRAALTEPWIFGQCLGREEPTLRAKAELLAELLRAQVSDLDWQEARRVVPGFLKQLGLPGDEDTAFRLADRRRLPALIELLEEQLAAGSPPPIAGNPFLR
jgi:tRNA-dihydrouridine synthase